MIENFLVLKYFYRSEVESERDVVKVGLLEDISPFPESRSSVIGRISDGGRAG